MGHCMRVLFGFVLASCGASCGTSPMSMKDGGDTSDASTATTPLVHRSQAVPCTAVRPPSTPSGLPGACMNDADCTMGMNGRCVVVGFTMTKCSYDECAMDGDCGAASVCECRQSTNDGANTCQRGNCKMDADCPSGFCSPSALSLTFNCRMNVSTGSFGYFCHSSKDECGNDSDCGATPTSRCIFNPDQARFTCTTIVCTK